MKTKQLANVLIKILGLSVFVHSIPSVLAGFFSTARMRGMDASWFYVLSSLVMTVIGVCLLVKSRAVTECLFKGEED